jgi:hypothetical protein
MGVVGFQVSVEVVVDQERQLIHNVRGLHLHAEPPTVMVSELKINNG